LQYEPKANSIRTFSQGTFYAPVRPSVDLSVGNRETA
jgi:hypothetical protein